MRAIADEADEAHSGWADDSFITATAGHTEYAYRASQTAPLFDAVASGTPDNWSSTAITWTNAAPRVWRISRTRPSGGSWSEWGGLTAYSQRPAAQPDPFYRQAVSQADTPGNTTSSATPTDWLTSNPGATATKGVWRTTRTRPAGETHYRFSTPTQITPPGTETEYAYRASQTAPLFDAVASGTPDNWSSTIITWTDAAPRVWKIRRTRPSGGSWSEWSTLEKHSQRPAAQLVSFYRQAVNNPGAPSSTTASATPANWATSNPGATTTLNVWQTQRSRPIGDTHYQFTTPIIFAYATGLQPPETESAYRRHTSGTTAPTFTASASTVPTGWFSSRQTPTSNASYEWRISRTRPAGGSWSSWGSATVVNTYTERGYAYKRHTIQARPPRRLPFHGEWGALPAGLRRVRRRHRATRPMSGGSAARGRRVGRGLTGAVPRWFLATPSVGMRISATIQARPPRRSVPRRVGCLMAGSSSQPESYVEQPLRVADQSHAAGGWVVV